MICCFKKSLCYFTFIICGLFVQKLTFAQISSSARDLAMAGSGIARPMDLGGILTNPAGIGGMKNPAFLLGYRYMYHQPDVRVQVVGLALPGRFVTAGFSANRYQLSSAYEELSFELSLARAIHESLSLGLGLCFHRFDVPASTKGFSSALKIGVQYRFGLGPVFALQLNEVTLFSAGAAWPGRKPMEMQGGIWYSISQQLALATDIAYRLDKIWDADAGFEYRMVPGFFNLRMGISARSLIPHAGFGLSYRSLCLDLASSFHPQLGVSPQIELRYEF